MDVRWKIGGAVAVVMLLSLWGMGHMTKDASSGGNTETVAVSDEGMEPRQERDRWKASSSRKEPQSVPDKAQKYDGALRRRSEPLKDPFHAAAHAPKSTGEAGTSSTASGGATTAVVGHPVPKKDSPPTLEGIIRYETAYRALIRWHGRIEIAKEGEDIGPWRVETIEEKRVTLQGKTGGLILEWQ